MARSDLGWIIALVSTERCYRRTRAIFEEREKEFGLSYERESDAMSAMQRKSCIVLVRNQKLEVEDLRGVKLLLSLANFSKDWQPLRALATFVADFCAQPTSQTLSIVLEVTDLESYRLATMAVSYCQEKEREAEIIDSEGRPVEPLYGPPVNITTKRCLFSLLDYVIRNGSVPNFEQFRNHHFGNLRLVEVQDPDRTRRDWTTPEDNRFVSALYATIRVLEKRRLIIKTMDKDGRKIATIEPTWNGAYSVIFSDLLPVFSQTLTPEE
ncbi:MAG: hypothetical protein JRN62_09525 [Nitrososphaerota archaeon]|nr:hypothetical protein [Nitrososphaerota archaeon]